MEKVEDNTDYIDLVCWSADHETASKRYEALLLTERGSMHSVVVMNWGKIGAKGAFKTEYFTNAREAQERFGAKVRDKRSRGYERNRSDEMLTVFKRDLPKHLSAAMWRYLKAEKIADAFTLLTGKAITETWIEESAELPPVVLPKAKPTHDYAVDPEWGMF